MANGIVKFVMGTAAEYISAVKDNDTLYFVTDERRLYKGAVPYSGGIFTTVQTLPTTGVINTIYAAANGSVSYWDGTQYKYLVKPLVQNITGSESVTDAVVTAKAVADYVESVTDRLDILEGAVTVEGSVAKAEKDAKDYADSLNAAMDTRVDTVEGDISDLEQNKADKATTLSGYGITNAYTKTETDTAISTAVANADHLKREIVNSLPAIANADLHTIYMVPTSASGASAGSDSLYDEYMVISGSWEKIGDSHVNMSDYYTKTQVDNAISAAQSNAEDYADGLITAEVTRADGAYATAAQGAKADTALQKADITTGSANGTIAVKGTDVAVKGLKSAAYTEASAYDAAGAAASALSDANDYTDQQIAANALIWHSIV